MSKKSKHERFGAKVSDEDSKPEATLSESAPQPKLAAPAEQPASSVAAPAPPEPDVPVKLVVGSGKSVACRHGQLSDGDVVTSGMFDEGHLEDLIKLGVIVRR